VEPLIKGGSNEEKYQLSDHFPDGPVQHTFNHVPIFRLTDGRVFVIVASSRDLVLLDLDDPTDIKTIRTSHDAERTMLSSDGRYLGVAGLNEGVTIYALGN
jgi:hypothetical protein